MNSNPHMISISLLIMIIGIFFGIIMFYKKFMDKGKSHINNKPSNVRQYTPQEINKSKEDEYHIGGITTDYFVLLLMKYHSLDYAGYSYDNLLNKKTQTGYNAFEFYNGMWKLFGVFDDVLAMDYVNNGYGTYYRNGVDVTYREERDEMAIRVDGMYMVGTLSEMKAFRDDPPMNCQILDILAASRNPSDYFGVIEEKIK